MPSWQFWPNLARDAADRILADLPYAPEQLEDVLRACAVEGLGRAVSTGGLGSGRMCIAHDVLASSIVHVGAHTETTYPTLWWEHARKDNTNRGYSYQIGREVLRGRLDLGAAVEAWVRTFEPLPSQVTESYAGFHVTYAARREYSTGQVLILPPDFDPASQRAWLVGRVGHVINHPTSEQVPVVLAGSADVVMVDVRHLRLLRSITRYL